MSDQEMLNPSTSDEIDLKILFQKLWLRRGLLIAVPLLFTFLAIIGLLVAAVSSSAPTVYFVELKGIEKSHYPNGAQFSPQDLLGPDVLDVAVTSVGISVDDLLRKSIQVEYGIPTTLGIQKKYEEKLSEEIKCC